MSTKTRLPKGLSVIDHNGMLLAKLYDTLIVEFNKDSKRLILRNGGWATKHTKKCINLVLAEIGIKIVQRKGQWLVHTKTHSYHWCYIQSNANDFDVKLAA